MLATCQTQRPNGLEFEYRSAGSSTEEETRPEVFVLQTIDDRFVISNSAARSSIESDLIVTEGWNRKLPSLPGLGRLTLRHHRFDFHPISLGRTTRFLSPGGGSALHSLERKLL